MMLLRVALALLVIAGVPSRAPAQERAAQDRPVDLELVLAVDASRSIDAWEYRLQREGYAQALTHPQVLAAITSGEHRRIALTYVEWSSTGEQAVMVPWMVIDGPKAARRFAGLLRAAPRRFRDATSVSGAIDFSARLFAANRIAGTRRVIDISGDGPNNRGRPSDAARDAAVAAGVTINGLAIVNDRRSRAPGQTEEADTHYRDHVIGGPGAFMIVVEDFDSFADGIRRKLVREIAAVPTARPPPRFPRIRNTRPSSPLRY